MPGRTHVLWDDHKTAKMQNDRATKWTQLEPRLRGAQKFGSIRPRLRSQHEHTTPWDSFNFWPAARKASPSWKSLTLNTVYFNAFAQVNLVCLHACQTETIGILFATVSFSTAGQQKLLARVVLIKISRRKHRPVASRREQPSETARHTKTSQKHKPKQKFSSIFATPTKKPKTQVWMQLWVLSRKFAVCVRVGLSPSWITLTGKPCLFTTESVIRFHCQKIVFDCGDMKFPFSHTGQVRKRGSHLGHLLLSLSFLPTW